MSAAIDSASKRAARAFIPCVCATLLAVLACGGDEEEGESAAASATAPEPAPPREEPPDLGLPSDLGSAEPEGAQADGLDASDSVDDRVGEVLDTEPEGSGLERLIRSALEDPSAEVREAAVVALGDSEEPRAVDALIEATDDSDRTVVLSAIDQLGWSEDRRAEDALRRLADSPDPEIAEAASDELEDE